MKTDPSTTMSPKQFEALCQLGGAQITYDSARRFALSFAKVVGHGQIAMRVSSARAAPQNAGRWQMERALNQVAGVPLIMNQTSGSVRWERPL